MHQKKPSKSIIWKRPSGGHIRRPLERRRFQRSKVGTLQNYQHERSGEGTARIEMVTKASESRPLHRSVGEEALIYDPLIRVAEIACSHVQRS